MRAKFIYEKFEEESDPIKDMGVGIETTIRDWVKNQEPAYSHLRSPRAGHSEVLLYPLIKHHAPKEYVKYVIDNTNFNQWELNHFLETALFNNNRDAADVILEVGGKPNKLIDKADYVYKLRGKKLSLTPEEEFKINFFAGNYNHFLKDLKSGQRITKGMINSLFKPESGSYGNYRKRDEPLHGKQKIEEYIKNTIEKGNIKSILHPKDYKRIDAIKNMFFRNKSEYQSYPKGYKIYRALKHIHENPGIRRTDLTKFIYDLSYGKDTFDPMINKGYWSDGFQDLIYPNVDLTKKTYSLTSVGKEKLKRLENYFKDIKIIPEPYI